MAKHCKCKQEECEECPEWIFTFADLVMLMMGFFVILWVLKPAPGKADTPEANEEWIKLAAKIREAFDYLPDPQSKDPVDQQMLLQKLQNMKPLKGPGDGGKTKIERKGAEGDQPEVVSVRRGNQAIVGSRVLFDVGSATLTPQATKILDQIALLIKGHKNTIFVKVSSLRLRAVLWAGQLVMVSVAFFWTRCLAVRLDRSLVQLHFLTRLCCIGWRFS